MYALLILDKAFIYCNATRLNRSNLKTKKQTQNGHCRTVILCTDGTNFWMILPVNAPKLEQLSD